jgi:hypothetical protein
MNTINGISHQYILNEVNRIFKIKKIKISIQQLRGDASNRKFFRVEMFPQNEKINSIIIMKLDEPYTGELDYLNIFHYLAHHSIPVPTLYHYDKEKGILFIEDLGDETLERKVKNEDTNVKRKYYREAIDTLLNMQHQCSENPNCVAFHREFDIEKFMWEFNFFVKWVIFTHRKKSVNEKDLDILNKYFVRISSILDAEPKYFSHRDYHSRNLLIHCGRIKIVDFQDARKGLCQYDLASLLRDSYILLDDTFMEEMLEYYIRRKEEVEGVRIDREKFRMIFDYTSIQRNLKAVSTFAYINHAKGNSWYLQFIPQTLEYVKKNFMRHKELEEFQEVLGKYLEELR